MNTYIFAALLLCLSHAAIFGQGTLYFQDRSITGSVTFANRVPAYGIDARVTFPDGAPVGIGFTAQLYGGLEGTPLGSLQPLLPTTGFLTHRPEALGYIEPVVIEFPTLQKRTFVLRVYDGPSWEDSNWRGESNPVSVTPATPTSLAHLNGLQPFSVYPVPEPSAAVLLSICGALLRLHSARKPRHLIR